MSVRSFAAQLGVRLAVIAALLAAAGTASYSATHWEPRSNGVDHSYSGTTGTTHR